MNNVLNSEMVTGGLGSEGKVMSAKMQKLMKELKHELEQKSIRKNVKVLTLIKRYRPTASERDQQIIRNHILKIADLTIAQVKVNDFVELHRHKPVSTAKKILKCFERVMQTHDESFRLPQVKYPNRGKRFTASQILEIDDILKVIDERVYAPYKLPCLVALYTGMRLGNVMALTKKNVDKKRREVRFKQNKGGNEMVLPISESLAKVFSRVPWPLDDETPLFPLTSTKQAVSLAVSRAFTRAGFPWFSFHKLRHTSACFLLEHGVELSTISALLGHSSINVTMEFYARVRPKKLQEAVRKWDVK